MAGNGLQKFIELGLVMKTNIEPNCKVVVVGPTKFPENFMRSGSAIKFIGKYTFIDGKVSKSDRMWEVDFPVVWQIGKRKMQLHICPEESLMRIDDPDLEKEHRLTIYARDNNE